MFIKIIALGIIGSLLAVILKKYCKELLPFFEIALVAAIVYILINEVAFNNSGFRKIFSLYSQSEELIMCIFKGAAIVVLSKFASGVCRDSGNALIGDAVEFGGRIMIVFLSMPYIEKVTEIALGFVK